VRTLRTVCGLICLVLVSTGVRAAEGRIPIFEPIVLDGTVGDISGKYVVTRNVEVADAVSPPFSAITIVGSGGEVIDIDLNGFTLGGALFDPSPVIAIENVKIVRLRNGAIVSTVSAIACAAIDAEQVILEDLTMTCGFQGLRLTSVKKMEIRRNTIESQGGGISVDGAGGLKGSIQDNLLSTGGQQGGPDAIAVDQASSGIILRGNQIEGGGSAGIHLRNATGALIEDNSLKSLAGPGILISSSSNCRIIRSPRGGFTSARPARTTRSAGTPRPKTAAIRPSVQEPWTSVAAHRTSATRAVGTGRSETTWCLAPLPADRSRVQSQSERTCGAQAWLPKAAGRWLPRLSMPYEPSLMPLLGTTRKYTLPDAAASVVRVAPPVEQFFWK